jgi:hypothetical protein
MVEAVAFQAALARVGVPADVQDAIVAQGLTRIQDLIMFQKEQIACMFKMLLEYAVDPVDINIFAKSRCLRLCVTGCNSECREFTPALFTPDVAQ